MDLWKRAYEEDSEYQFEDARLRMILRQEKEAKENLKKVQDETKDILVKIVRELVEDELVKYGIISKK